MKRVKTDAGTFTLDEINYNMRCIETMYPDRDMDREYGINYNMRCIETLRGVIMDYKKLRINYNMRCIETTEHLHLA